MGRALRRARAVWLGKGMVWQSTGELWGKWGFLFPLAVLQPMYDSPCLTVKCLLRPLKFSFPYFS